MKVVVDRSNCVGHGMCQMYAPSVFELDEEEKSTVLTAPTTAELRAAAQLGADSCPQRAITIIDEEG